MDYLKVFENPTYHNLICLVLVLEFYPEEIKNDTNPLAVSIIDFMNNFQNNKTGGSSNFDIICMNAFAYQQKINLKYDISSIDHKGFRKYINLVNMIHKQKERNLEFKNSGVSEKKERVPTVKNAHFDFECGVIDEFELNEILNEIELKEQKYKESEEAIKLIENIASSAYYKIAVPKMNKIVFFENEKDIKMECWLDHFGYKLEYEFQSIKPIELHSWERSPAII